MGLKTLVSAEEFARLAETEEDVRLELDEGEVITMAPASARHGQISVRVVSPLFVFAERHSLGLVFNADTGFQLSKNIVRAPDAAFVRKDRAHLMAEEGFFKGAPDLAVEVFSPSDSVPQLMRKVKQYLRAGCQLIWVVYPETRTVHVFEASGEDRILTADDILDAPSLLPGFSLPVLELFPG